MEGGDKLRKDLKPSKRQRELEMVAKQYLHQAGRNVRGTSHDMSHDLSMTSRNWSTTMYHSFFMHPHLASGLCH